MGKQFQSYREGSRINWGTDLEPGGALNRDQINTGCMLRIADATEAMAKNHLTLQADYDYMRGERDRYRSLYNQQQRQIAALRGHITRLKKAKNLKMIVQNISI